MRIAAAAKRRSVQNLTVTVSGYPGRVLAGQRYPGSTLKKLTSELNLNVVDNSRLRITIQIHSTLNYQHSACRASNLPHFFILP